MAKGSFSHTDFMIFLALAASAVVGYLLYRHYEKNVTAEKKAVDTAPSVPNARGGALEVANAMARYGAPMLV